MEVALRDGNLLAYEFDGEILEEDYGGPVRGFCPYLWGYKSAKSVVKIELMTVMSPVFGNSEDIQTMPSLRQEKSVT